MVLMLRISAALTKSLLILTERPIPIDVQEFMVMPVGAETFSQALQMGAEIFHALKAKLKADGHNTNVGDEGGFAPNLASSEVALEYIMSAITAAGYTPGKDVFLAMDVAASEFYVDGKYELKGEGKSLTSEQFVDYLEGLFDKFPIISIEDGMDEDDWDGWAALTDRIGHKCQLVGDDLFVTNLTGTFRPSREI